MDPPKVRSTRRGRTDCPSVKEEEAVFRGGEQVGSITSKNWQSWLKQRHTRECRRFYEDHGNTAAGAMMLLASWHLQEIPPDNWVVVGKRYQPQTEETAGEIARVEHSSLGYRKLDIEWHKTNRIIRVVGVAYNASGWVDNIKKLTVMAKAKTHKRMPTVLWGSWQYSSWSNDVASFILQKQPSETHFWAIFKTNVILCTLEGHHTFCFSNT